METAGFYKLDVDADPQDMFYAPNFVYAPTFTLLKENKDQYNFPIDGWYWFDSVEQARAHWNLPEPEPEGETQ